MAQKIYVDYNGLKYYDEKLKAWVEAKDAKVLADAIQAATDMGENYEPAGSVATAVQNLKDGEIKTNADAIAVLNGTGAGSVSKAVADAKSELQGKIDAANGRIDATQGEVDALETYVGTFTSEKSTTVIEYINEKTSGIATDASLANLEARVAQAEKDIDAVEADYLKAADKTELSTAISTEKSRAEGVEAGLDERLAAVEGDYLKKADKEELSGNIQANADSIAAVKEDVDAFFKDADLTEQAKDTLKELQAYIASDETATSAMLASIKQNADDIDAVEAAVATKVENSVYTEKMTALDAKDEDFETRIAAMEAELGDGEGSVAEQIAAAKQEAIETAGTNADAKDAEILTEAKEYALDEAAKAGTEAMAQAQTYANTAESNAKSYTDTEIGKVNSTINTLTETVGTKAAQSDLDDLAGRVTTAEGKVSTLETKMTAVEAKASANETAIAAANTEIAKKAAQTDVDALVSRMDTHDGHYSALADRVTTVEGLVGEGFVSITNAQVDELFA